ncbi:lanC-like protein 3 [Epargyreus clarus]|uniref:lanC-like protein 3 n=1 Tax=Epargyreus clarus TaxID=520877 RepID=UPI003C2CA1F8
MNRILKRVYSCSVFKILLSGVGISTSAATMVRYFPNPFEDYSPEVDLVIPKDSLVQQITDHVNTITKRFKPTQKNVDGGLYVGVTGISYMFYRLSKNPELIENRPYYVQKSMEYLAPALETSAGESTSFLLGDCGTYALATVVMKNANDERFVDMMRQFVSLYARYLEPNFIKCGADELFVGRAGYIAAALWMHRELGTPVLSKEELYKICDVIVESGRERNTDVPLNLPLMYHYYKTYYLGAAHGTSFILQMLITVPNYLEYNPRAAKEIRDSIEILTLLQKSDGNFPSCLEEVRAQEHKLVHWCHGAPGIVYLLAKAAMVFPNDERFMQACENAADAVWEKGLLYKGPGICHGVAGNAYVFLLLYRLTKNPKYLHRAKCFANFMTTEKFINDARLPDNPMSLYEGYAGTTCFLSDLLWPEAAEFPFEDVFYVY